MENLNPSNHTVQYFVNSKDKGKVQLMKRKPLKLNKTHGSYQTSQYIDNLYNTISEKNYDDDDEIEPHILTKTAGNPEESDLGSLLNLSLRLKKKYVHSSPFHEQSFPMLASLCASKLKSAYKAPIDLVCVIDHSGSMKGEKIQLVKNTFNFLLKYMGDDDRLSIVIFDDNASRLTPLLRTTEKNKKKILSSLKIVQGEGGTDINLGIMHALQTLKQRRYVNPVTSIFLLSDGLDGGAQGRIKASLEKFAVSDDITINTFGFGSDHDPQLMSDIADLRDGNFYFIDKLDTIDETFVDCLGGLLSSISQNVQIRIKPEQSETLQGVEIVKAYGEAAMWNLENQTYVTKMSNLISGRQKDFLLELKIPKNSKELQDQEKYIRIGSAEAEITGLDGQVVKKCADLHVTLLNEEEELKEDEEDDREVMKNFYRIKGASLMTEARKLADEARNEEAKKLLQNFKEELENSFLHQESFIKNLIKDIENAMQYVDPVLYQKMGRHSLLTNARAQIYQKSNFESCNFYRNELQTEMLEQVREMKSESLDTHN